MLYGNDIDVIRRTILSITERSGKCPAATLASELKRLPNSRFKPENWGGYPSFKDMMQGYSKFFEVYYENDSKTNLCIRIKERDLVENHRSEDQLAKADKEIDYKEVADKIGEQYYALGDMNISVKFESPCILKTCALYRIYKLESEGKLIKKEGILVCHSGFYANGIEPIYIFAKKDQGELKVQLINRRSREGRNLVRLLGNIEPQDATFDIKPCPTNSRIEPEIGHILNDHIERLPDRLMDTVRNHPACSEELRELPNACLVATYSGFFRRQLEGAIAIAAKKLANNTIVPVPFWYKRNNKISWLIPIELGLDDTPSIALVLGEEMFNNESVLRAYTVLDLKTAFKNARLLGPVTAPWLVYDKIFGPDSGVA